MFTGTSNNLVSHSFSNRHYQRKNGRENILNTYHRLTSLLLITILIPTPFYINEYTYTSSSFT